MKNRTFIILLIIASVMLSFLTGCTYFYPLEGRYHAVQPELIEQKKVELDSFEVRKTDVYEGFDLGEESGRRLVYVNDPKKTTIVRSEIERAKILKLHVKPDDYVKQGDILVEYVYEVNKDAEFQVNWNKRRAEIRYENAYIQYQQGRINEQTLENLHKSYIVAKNALDSFNAIPDKYTLRAPVDGHIAKIEGDTVSTEEVQTLAFHICNIEDGILLTYAREQNQYAAYPFMLCFEGTGAELYDEQSDRTYSGRVSMSNMKFKKEYVDDLSYFSGGAYLYLVLELTDNKIPEDVSFYQEFTGKLIRREAHDVLIVSRSAVDMEKSDDPEEPFVYQVYKILPDNTIERVRIKIGDIFDAYYEVIEGLEEGDKVVLR
ncbi:MAG TPA: hypothetical protein PKJ65_05600 [Clostridia bacterium]|jgi:multidrug efflux pump subunit AcrA (membrane-fusion protein)|nr:hypothetical protein [Clostridia bacterium]